MLTTIYCVLVVLVAMLLAASVEWRDDYEYTFLADIIIGAALWPLLLAVFVGIAVAAFIKERAS